MSVKQKIPHPSLFLTDKIKMNGIPTNIKLEIHPFYCIWLFEGTSSLHLLFYVRFYISRYYFSLVFRALYNNIWKKCFRQEFYFFNGFTQPPRIPLLYTLNGENPLSVTKVFCRCSLIPKAKLDWFCSLKKHHKGNKVTN